MNLYESSTPRPALGLSAVALAAFSIGALVVLPAYFDCVSAERCAVAAAPTATRAALKLAP